ncbi:MAG: type IV pilus secretin family protein [Oscillatoriales cyanobacterium]|nr:MAG: type IV pilus secretin family protein [Oscillatoriales cyanobacterium]
MSGLATMAIVQPVRAQTSVTDVRISSSGGGVDVELVTDSAERPQVFLLPPQGTSLIAHVAGARLDVPGGNVVRANPAPGIAAVEVTQLDSTTVQIAVRGTSARPTGRIRPSNSNAVLLSYAGTAAPPQSTPANPSRPISQVPNNPPANPGAGAPNVMIPNPTITIDGQPAVLTPAVAPPTMPRAIAPPVGDIAVSDLPIQPYTINLGSNQIIPRLVLRDAPVREVLSLLARASGVNIAFSDNASSSATPGSAPGAAAPAAGADARISLDIENESAQDVFNYVLRISGLQASRNGRTVFVGRNLPNSARDVSMRAVRLNQVRASDAAGYLVALGAESVSYSTERTTEVVQVGGNQQQGSGNAQVQAAPLTQTRTSERTVINSLRSDPKDSVPILRGLQVAVDTRTNAITLVGQRDLVALASEQLSRIDSRLRQVVVNVRVVDINLLQNDRLGTSFSFGVGGARIVNTGGIGVINWSDRGAPFSTPTTLNPADVGLRPFSITPNEINGQNPNGFNIANDFLAQLQASIVNRNAKILTDPTLVVQEGQVANVELTEEVVGTVEQEVETTDVGTTTSRTLTKDKAGLILGIQVERIDDNGFVTLSVSPSLKVPVDTFGSLGEGLFATLLAERKLSSGTIRIRDGQTLVLAGIIQDTDRSEVRKIPILGDLPLLGSLFRRTDRRNERKELVVLLTPQLLDDSNASSIGYSYTPSRDAQEVIQRTNLR